MRRSMPLLILWLIGVSAYADYIPVHQFSGETANPYPVVIEDGVAYGFSGGSGNPFFFSFNLDGSDFRSRAANLDLADSFVSLELAPLGTMAFHDGRLFARARYDFVYDKLSGNSRPARTILEIDARSLSYSHLLGVQRDNGWQGIDLVAGGAHHPIQSNGRLFFYANSVRNSDVTSTPFEEQISDGPGLWSVSVDGEGLQELVTLPRDGIAILMSDDGNTLYGALSSGNRQTGAMSTIFSVSADGSAYQELATVEGSVIGLIASEERLYLASFREHIYSMRLDGSDLERLWSGPSNGRIVLSDDFLFGATSNEVFRLNVDGSGYLVLNEFDNASLNRDLQLLDDQLYGTSRHGDGFTGQEGGGFFYAIANVFRVQAVPEPSSMLGWLAMIAPVLLLRWKLLSQQAGVTQE